MFNNGINKLNNVYHSGTPHFHIIPLLLIFAIKTKDMQQSTPLSYTDREKEKYLISAPTHIRGSVNPKLIRAWCEFKKAEDLLEEHPDRYLHFINKDNEAQTSDCSIPNYKIIIRKKGGSEANVKEAERRFKKLNDLSRLKARKKITLNKLTGDKFKNKNILEIEESKILEWFGKFYTVEDVQQKIKKEFSYTVRIDNLRKWFKDHELEIDRMRADYTLRHKDFRIATDSGRLDTLNGLLLYFEEKFTTNGKIEYSREIRAILEQARKEVKGNELHLTVDGKINIEATLQANVNIMQTMQRIPINSLVIAMTAAKQGINPERIMAQLASSYYKNVSGFNGEITGQEDYQLPGKLIKQYDWGELRRLNHDRKDAFDSLNTDVNLINADEKTAAEQRKKDLLQSVMRFQSKLHNND